MIGATDYFQRTGVPFSVIVISQLTHMTWNSKVMPKQTMSYDHIDVLQYLTPYNTALC